MKKTKRKHVSVSKEREKSPEAHRPAKGKERKHTRGPSHTIKTVVLVLRNFITAGGVLGSLTVKFTSFGASHVPGGRRPHARSQRAQPT